jgi:ABC-type glycerol-3-phosphate transport system substrate-binding protein
MTNNKMIRGIAGLFVAGLLAASCGGSSDESSTAEFCEKIIQDMADSAPGEIKDEVALMNNLFKDLFEAGDDEEKLLAIFTGSDSEAFDAAGEKLDAWEAENCEASTSSAPASAVGRI